MNNVNSNTALRRLAAEGVSLKTVRKTIKEAMVQREEADMVSAREAAEEIRRRGKSGGNADEAAASSIEEAAAYRLKQAHDAQAHYPGVRAETAQALGFRPGPWWDEIYNLATR